VLRGLDDFRVRVQENGVGSMDVAVNDKQILITGATNGIGLAAAEALALVSRFRAMRLQHEKQQ